MSQSTPSLHNEFDDVLTIGLLLLLLPSFFFSSPHSSIESLRIPDDCLSYWIDCRQYLDPAPTLILETASIEKAFKSLIPPFPSLPLSPSFCIPHSSATPIRSCSCLLTHRHRMFRTLGLRHLIVIDYRCKVSGIVTRKDLLPSELKYHKIKKSKLQSYFPIIDSFQPTLVTFPSLSSPFSL
jgi:hypothetical protein